MLWTLTTTLFWTGMWISSWNQLVIFDVKIWCNLSAQFDVHVLGQFYAFSSFLFFVNHFQFCDETLILCLMNEYAYEKAYNANSEMSFMF